MIPTQVINKIKDVLRTTYGYFKDFLRKFQILYATFSSKSNRFLHIKGKRVISRILPQ